MVVDTVLNVDAPGVLVNDIEVDPTDAVYTTLDPENGPMYGVLDLREDGSFTYTPEPGFMGVDKFTYLMMGIPERNLVDKATVTIYVNSTNQYFLPLFVR